MRGPRPLLTSFVLIAGAIAAMAHRGMAAEADSLPRVHPGAIELGLAGAMTSIAGSVDADVRLRAGMCGRVANQLIEVGIEPSYDHVEGLDVLGVEATLDWIHHLRDSREYVFLSIGGGIRQEWLGSFSEARYPLGAGLGVGHLLSNTAGIRAEYRYRRILDDPVADYSEQSLLVGLSVFLRNRPR